MRKSVPLEKERLGWLVRRPVKRGELLCQRNSSWWSPCFVHSFSRVSAKPMMRKRNRTGAILPPCFTPTSKGIVVSIFPMMSLTALLLYMRAIANRRFGGQPYRSRILMRRTWLDVSNALTKSANKTQVGRLWACRKCRSVLIVKLSSWQPTPGVDPNWYLTQCNLMILNNHVQSMELNIFEPMSMRVTPRHLLGSPRSPLLGTGTTRPSCHSSKSISPRQ